MNVLILGASSKIGQSLAKQFSKNNLLLLTTNKEKLNGLMNQLESSAINVIEVDLSKEIRPEEIIKDNVDIFINAACSTSTLRNKMIDPYDYKRITMVDLINPLNILEYLIKKNADSTNSFPLHYIFINTILSKIQSPGNSIYYSYKIIHQEYINNLKNINNNRLKFTNVVVGTQINRTIESKKTDKLAKAIYSGIENDKPEFIFGSGGKLIYYLFHINPILSNSLIYIKRLLFK